jgi:hypothetical protein
MVENGDTLSADRIPTCKSVTGYTVRWEDKDFSKITSGATVQAIATANTYKVTYQLEDDESVGGAKTITVEYNAHYQLATPSCTDTTKYFSCWKNAATGEKVAINGTWKIDGDVVLVADWVEDKDWTNNH